MQKRKHKQPDEMRPEYDFSAQPGRVQGKYYQRAIAGTNLVLIEPEIAEAFPTGEAVNAALRSLLRKPRSRRIRRQSKPRTAGRRSR